MWIVIWPAHGLRSMWDCATAARSGSSSQVSMCPSAVRPAAIESVAWPLKVPISSTRRGWAAQTSISSKRPATGPVSIWPEPSVRCVSSDSAASHGSCGEVTSSA